MDHYLNYKNQLKRLINEYEKYGKVIIAYDFDDTIYDYHKQNGSYDDVIKIIKQLKDYAYFICFTCRSKDCYNYVKGYIESKGLPMDTFNNNIIELDFTMSKKPFFNVLIDDRAGIINSYILLLDFLNYIEVKHEKRKIFKFFKRSRNICKKWFVLTQNIWMCYC